MIRFEQNRVQTKKNIQMCKPIKCATCGKWDGEEMTLV